MLQERIEELNSSIIDIYEDKIKLTGFLSAERLLDYYDKGSDCRFSVELYPKEEFDIAYVKDNALVLIMENGKEIHRYKFVPVIKDTINYKDNNNNNRSRVFTIRHCSFSGKYNYKDIEKSLLFDSKGKLVIYLKFLYDFDLSL